MARFRLVSVLGICLGGCAGGTPASGTAPASPPAPSAPVSAALPEGAVQVAKGAGDGSVLSDRLAKTEGKVTFASAKIAHQGDKDWLVQRTAKGDGCVVRRVSLVSRDGGLWAVPGTSQIEWCTGQNCMNCDFKDSGGCACLEPVSGSGVSLCNHSIMKGENDFAGILLTK